MGQYSFDFDRTKQRFYIKFSGFFRAGEADKVFEDLRAYLKTLPDQFDTVTDLSGFKPASPGVARGFQDAAELVKAKGRRRGVRVGGKVVTGLMQFKREIGGVFDEGTTKYASTIEEAERMLDEWT